jgi:1,2-phenylacetyl-CoA epoxidase PaaB subunit
MLGLLAQLLVALSSLSAEHRGVAIVNTRDIYRREKAITITRVICSKILRVSPSIDVECLQHCHLIMIYSHQLSQFLKN